jgi:hypothetical protein
MRYGRMVVLAMAAVALGADPVSPTAQDPCDPALPRIPGDPNGYRFRGDRCEGIYIREVSGNTTLLVGSFTEAVGEFAPSASGHLKISWAPLVGSVLRLRAQAFRHRLHYRMDAIRSANDTSYLWPSSILAVFNLTKSELGILGATSRRVGTTVRDVFVPLRIGEGTQLLAPRRQLVVVPGEQLKEVFVSLKQIAADGTSETRLRQEEPLGKSYYPAGKPIEITLPELVHPGTYRLELGATLSRGGSSTETVWLYLP